MEVDKSLDRNNRESVSYLVECPSTDSYRVGGRTRIQMELIQRQPYNDNRQYPVSPFLIGDRKVE